MTLWSYKKQQAHRKSVRPRCNSCLISFRQVTPQLTKVLANFTQSGDEPTTKNTGDLYINNALADGTWAWSANSGGVTDVSPGDRAIWNGTNWDVIQSGAGDVGVTEVQGTLPIIVTDGDTDTPVVSVREATTTLDGTVARLAT